MIQREKNGKLLRSRCKETEMEERDIKTLMQSDGNVGRNVRVDILHLFFFRGDAIKKKKEKKEKKENM